MNPLPCGDFEVAIAASLDDLIVFPTDMTLRYEVRAPEGVEVPLSGPYGSGDRPYMTDSEGNAYAASVMRTSKNHLSFYPSVYFRTGEKFVLHIVLRLAVRGAFCQSGAVAVHCSQEATVMLKDKIVWITGAGSGIGAETAKLLASRGAVPILTGRNEERLRKTASEIGARCGVYRLDVTDNDQVLDVARRIQSDFGPVDVLINNAGFGIFEMFKDATLDHIESMMDTNYMGMVRCVKAVLPSFLARRDGHIVNIASIAGKFSTPKSAGYSASKHAVLGFTNALRLELAGTGIAVSAVNPGPIDTPFFEIADPEGHYVRNVRRFMMSPEKVAARIVKVIEKRKAEVDLPFAAAIGVKLYHLFPRIGDRVAGSWLNRK